MRRRMFFSAALLAITMLAGAFSGACVANERTKPMEKANPLSKPENASFAVIELFTSEGCSSCPPADRVISDLVREAQKDGRRVFPLAFHVDYWNRLGWSDRFSDAAYSDRQRAYAAKFKTESIYTPQAVVNGEVEFVGSDRKRMNTEIGKALDAVPPVSLSISTDPVNARREVVVRCAIKGELKKGTMNIAVVERDLQTKVPRGENAGQALSHDNVVRAFKSVALDGADGHVDLVLPADVTAASASVIVYLQDASLRTIAASAADLTLPSPHP